MVTINDLIGGHNHVSNFSEKVERLQAILDNVIKPLEEQGINITVTKGLLSNTEVSSIQDVFLRRDHIYGYGVDIQVADSDKEKVFTFVSNDNKASAKSVGDNIHISYDKNIVEQSVEELIEE